MKIKQNNIKWSILLLVIIATNYSCQPEHHPKQDKISQISQTESILYKAKEGVINKKEAANMIHLYVDFADTYPKDSISPYYLFKAADVSVNTFHSDESIALFNKLLKDYPDFEKAPHALFLKAFTYENYLHQLDSAEVSYQLFLAKYPNHAFANDAKISLDNLGKTPEEIIEGFNKK